ncbi:hypothetical protein ACX1HO_20665 [Yersinia enterocolitica]|uniref:hypothetical protein n=2 Tax=Yersinia enterocolitica TaxID=630 RepID=UPI00094B8B11|nr:hypothetical protein [Yersinia enterocolitica]
MLKSTPSAAFSPRGSRFETNKKNVHLKDISDLEANLGEIANSVNQLKGKQHYTDSINFPQRRKNTYKPVSRVSKHSASLCRQITQYFLQSPHFQMEKY